MEVCGRTVPAIRTDEGIRATSKDEPIDPASVERYLATKFGEQLERVEAAMQLLAKAYTSKELAEAAYRLYERFRPAIPSGKKGWGAEGKLDLGLIARLAARKV